MGVTLLLKIIVIGSCMSRL